MRRAFLILVALVLSLLSCSSHEGITCRFDDNVSAEDRHRFVRTAAKWNLETTEDDQFTFTPDGDYLLSTPEDIRVRGNLQMDGRECTDEGEDCEFEEWVRVRRTLAPERKDVVMLHELGHALGLEHLKPTQVGIMQPGTNAREITDLDREECRKAGACGSITVRAVTADEEPWFRRLFRRKPKHRCRVHPS